MFHQMNDEFRLSRNEDYDKKVTAKNASSSTIHRLILPYKSEQGRKTIKSVNKYSKRLLPEDYTAGKSK